MNAAARAPESRTRHLHVSVICTGNICRSPIGEQMLRSALAEAGLADSVRVSSAGTGDWHIGQRAHRQTEQALQRAGFPTDHRARQITPDELGTVDLALAADRGHVLVLRRMTDSPDKVRLLRSFDPDADFDEVPDPYGCPDAAFDEVVAMTAAAIPGVVAEVRRLLG